MDNQTDRALLATFVADQNEKAFAKLVERHAPMVRQVTVRILGQSGDLDDVFQETFLTLMLKARRVLKHHSIAGWIYHVALRNSLETRSKRIRRKESPISSSLQSALGEPWEMIAELNINEVLLQELDRLPHQYREPVILFHFEGVNRQDIAQRMNLSLASVKGLLSRGRKLLKTNMVRRGHGSACVLPVVSISSATIVSANLIENTVQYCIASQTVALAAPLAKSTAALFQTLTTSKAVAVTAMLTGFLIYGAVIGRLGTPRTEIRPTNIVISSLMPSAKDDSVSISQLRNVHHFEHSFVHKNVKCTMCHQSTIENNTTLFPLPNQTKPACRRN